MCSTVLDNLNLAVWYGISIRTYMYVDMYNVYARGRIMADFNLAVERLTTKLLNFPAIQYVIICSDYTMYYRYISCFSEAPVALSKVQGSGH